MTKIQKPDSPAQRKPPLAPNGAPRWLRPTVGANLLARAVDNFCVRVYHHQPKAQQLLFWGDLLWFCAFL